MAYPGYSCQEPTWNNPPKTIPVFSPFPPFPPVQKSYTLNYNRTSSCGDASRKLLWRQNTEFATLSGGFPVYLAEPQPVGPTFLRSLPKEGFVQRYLSIATLGVIGWLIYLFLQGGGLGQVGTDAPNNAGVFNPNAQYQTPGNWNAPTAAQPAATNASAIQVPGLPNSGPVVRIASFNIQDFGNNKARLDYVMLRLADMLRKFDIVAVQEISTNNDYLVPEFVKLVNSPSANQPARKYDHVIGPRLGRSSTDSQQYAFLYDTDRVQLDPQSVYTINDPDDLLHREPLVATFMAKGVAPDVAFTFTLINVNADPNPRDLAVELDALAEVYRVVRRSPRQEDDVILLGTLHADDRHLQRLGQLPGIAPLIAGVWTNAQQNAQLDNLILHQPSTTEWTGRSGVFDVMRNYNLTEQQALEISNHFPVWAEFSVYERDYQGRVARRELVGVRL
jgi:deoxyribonuclease-1-like protein